MIITPALKPRQIETCGDFEEVFINLTENPPNPVLLPAIRELRNDFQNGVIIL